MSQLTRKPFPAAQHFGLPIASPASKGKNEARAVRQSHIKRSVEQWGPISLRKMQGHLAGKGVFATHVTIGNDYKALGL